MRDEMDEEDVSATGPAVPVPESTTSNCNPRASRNMAEKQRRDNLNTNISNMATLVPTVAGSPRRLDKISILRLGATYLRTEYALGPGNASFLPRKYNKIDLEKFLFETLIHNDGFMIVVTSTGKIVYIGRQVEQYLGHAQADLLGQSLYNFVYPDDHEELTRNLTPNESINRLMIMEGSGPEENSNCSEDSRATGNNELLFGEERKSFNIRMSQRAASRREHVQYECLHISGLLRPADACRNITPGSERAKRHHEINATSNDIIFVGIARMMKRRITELSLLEANKEEYVTRHLVDGRIIFCDHRISVVAGYMTHEVSGQNAFSYMHEEDVPWTITALRQMYGQGESFGSSCYRLMTKTGEYIYLRTHAYLEVDRDRQLFESFICVNTSVSKEEGEKLMSDMRARYSATIASAKSFLACDDGSNVGTDTQTLVPKVAVKDPLQLENAISHLMSDFVSPTIMENNISSSPVPDTQSMKVVFMSQHFPPPAIQASKIGIKCIDRPVSLLNGKDKTIKREANIDSPVSIQSRHSENSNDCEEPRNQSQSYAVSSSHHRGDKIMPEINVKRDEMEKFNSQASTPNSHYTNNDDDYYKTEPSPVSSSSLTISNEETSSLERINLESRKSPSHHTSRVNSHSSNRGKPESMFAYVKSEKKDSKNGIDITERSNNCTIKRSNLDDSTNSSKKKRRSAKNIGPCSTGNGTSEIVDKRNANQYDKNSQPFVNYKDDRIIDPGSVNCKLENIQRTGNDPIPRDNDSPCSNLKDLPIDYQTLNPNDSELSVYEDDFPDLLTPSLDDNPDLMQIFDDLGPVIGFEKNLDDRTIQDFPNNDQAVSEGLKRTHIELANRMTIQKNQLCVLEHELETPALQSQFFKPRETLIELRAEHKKNARMLKTIQQDHHNNMQTNAIKQNIGV